MDNETRDRIRRLSERVEELEDRVKELEEDRDNFVHILVNHLGVDANCFGSEK